MMAYMDFSGAFALPPSCAQASAEVAPRTNLSPLEWRVVQLARGDSLRSLREPRPLARLIGRLFGFSHASRLADAQLEALRRLAVFAWHKGYTLPQSEITAFLAAGYSLDQMERLLADIGRARLALRTRRSPDVAQA